MAIQHTLQLSVQVGTVRTYSYTMYRTRLTVSAARDDRDRETPHTVPHRQSTKISQVTDIAFASPKLKHLTKREQKRYTQGNARNHPFILLESRILTNKGRNEIIFVTMVVMRLGHVP